MKSTPLGALVTSKPWVGNEYSFVYERASCNGLPTFITLKLTVQRDRHVSIGTHPFGGELYLKSLPPNLNHLPAPAHRAIY